jgi:hypothetical protein
MYSDSCLELLIPKIRNNICLVLQVFLIVRKSKNRDSVSTESNDEKFSTPTGKTESHVFVKPADPKPPIEITEKLPNEELERKQSVEKTVS